LKLPLDVHQQNQLSVSTRPLTRKEIAEAAHDHPELFTFKVGLQINKKVSPADGLLVLDIAVAPAAMLEMIKFPEVQSEVRDGKLELRLGEARATIDVATGRPLEIVVPDLGEGESLWVRTVPHAMAARQRELAQKLAAKTPAAHYDSANPWRAAAEFLLNESVLAHRRVLAASGEEETGDLVRPLTALRKLVSRWDPPALWTDEPDRTDGFPKPKRFKLPYSRINWYAFSGRDLAQRQKLAADLLGKGQEILPRDGWPWLVCREALLARSAAEPLAPAADAGDAVGGPICKLVRLWAGLARPSELRDDSSPEAFRRDYRPLLSGDGLLSEWLLSLAEAARTLEADEMAALATLVPKAECQQATAALLINLRAQPERSIAGALADGFDALWQGGLKERVASLLPKPFAPEHTAAKPPPLKPLASPADSPLGERLKALEENDLKTSRGEKTGPPPESPVLERPKQTDERTKKP
jgi:hypothetical protein